MDLVPRNYVVILIVILLSVVYVTSDNPKVSTKFGDIVGKEITIPLELPYKNVHQYLGIPYAKPPVGDLRFEKPENVSSLPTPFNAQSFSAICPQHSMYDPNAKQSEDCLYLNIYVPDRPEETAGGHAVMIWIHGGSFVEGAGSQYDFSVLSISANIIVVTFNYRLGVFGFFASSDENARGNYGLWDQHKAFQWVHENIGDFGGNNEKVTIIGESAGAMSVTQHALVPANRGLFQRIIAQSGSMSMPAMDIGRDRKQDVYVLAESVGCKTDSMYDMIKCLKTKDAEELLGTSVNFSPTVDGELIRINTADIAKIAETRSLDEVEFFRSLDILSGFNANDGAFMMPMIMPLLPKELQTLELENLIIDYNNWKNDYVPAVMKFSLPMHFADELIRLVEAQYTPWPAHNDNHLLRLQFEKLIKDLYFAVPAIELARLHKTPTSANNFMYYFAPKPSIRLIPTPSWIPGAGHADEIMFMMGAFGMLGVGEENAWENDLMIKMMTYWSNFVKSGYVITLYILLNCTCL